MNKIVNILIDDLIIIKYFKLAFKKRYAPYIGLSNSLVFVSD